MTAGRWRLERRVASLAEQSSASAPRLLADAIRRAVGSGQPLSLVQAVDHCQASGADEHITVETVFTQTGNPIDLIEPRGMDVERADAGDVRVMWLADDEGDWFIAAWPSGKDHVFHLVTTVHATHRRWSRADRWLSSARGVIRTFLNHDDFEGIGTRLTEYGDVEVGRVTARSTADGSSDARGWKATDRRNRPNHVDVISLMEDQGYSVRTMTLHVADTLSLHLRRLAGATYYSGDFEVFAEVVLAPLASAAHNRRALLVDRERTPDHVVRPLTLSLPSTALDGAHATALLVREVASLPNTTLAVFHRNPYLHFAITDEVDGSNFDVFVTEGDSIVLYPGFRASPEAFARLTDHISDRFGAEWLGERATRRFTLAELSLG